MSFPPNFSWVSEGLLAALAFPGEKAHLRYLVDHGVTHLVSLTAEDSPPVKEAPELEWHQLKIHDFTPPTMAQVEEFIKIVKEAKQKKTAVAIHCAAGKGRTGTMVACFLVYSRNLTATDAIKLIRELRPGSVETEEQEKLIAEYEAKLRTEVTFPPNFSWVSEGLLAALAFPGEIKHLRYLVNQGVTHLVSLTAEDSPPVKEVPELQWHQLKIHDFTPPTMAQVEEFLKIVNEARQKKTAVAIHCAAGRGRTGTMVACFLVKERHLTAKDAIAVIRELRPGSVETVEQEQLIAQYEAKLRKEQNWKPQKR